MAAASEHKEAAWAFIEFAMGEEGQTIAATLGRTVPSMRTVAASSAFLNPDQPPANSQVWLDALDHMHILPKTENWIAIERVAATELEQGYMGLQPLDTVIANIQAAAADNFVAIK
jgi:multiple sugar transport system substrate-binding protein